MTKLTNDELDRARAEEAYRLTNADGALFGCDPTVVAARLAREGWTPTPEVDADVLAVREVLAKDAAAAEFPEDAARYMAGKLDGSLQFYCALLAFRAGKEARAAELVRAAKALIEAHRKTDLDFTGWCQVLAERVEDLETALSEEAR